MNVANLSSEFQRLDKKMENLVTGGEQPMTVDSQTKTPEVLIHALRQYRHNQGEGFVRGFDYDETVKAFDTLAAEVRRLREELRESKSNVEFLMDYGNG